MVRGYIYKITNKVNGKLYIGKTEHMNPYDRWIEHMQDYTKERNNNRYLYRAMKKYGLVNFEFEIVEKVYNDTLDNREKYYIQMYDTYENGYNMTLGGDGKERIDREKVINDYLITHSYIKTAANLNIQRRIIRNIIEQYELISYDVGKLSIEEVNNLKELASKYSMEEVGRQLGISGKAVRKRCDKFGIKCNKRVNQKILMYNSKNCSNEFDSTIEAAKYIQGNSLSTSDIYNISYKIKVAIQDSKKAYEFMWKYK